jgi:hypothetical protein
MNKYDMVCDIFSLLAILCVTSFPVPFPRTHILSALVALFATMKMKYPLFEKAA